MQDELFKSFFMGGFECSSHRNSQGRRLDLIDATRHDEFAEADYARMIEIGMLTGRDGVRWHLIETEPFSYDFSSLAKQVAAAKATGIQIIWDLFHYGFPDDIDIFSAEFIERFARFCSATAVYLQEELGPDLIVCPVNEISFFAWIAGEKGVFYPSVKKRGDELKAILIRAALAATDAIRDACPTARFVLTDPAIHVAAQSDTPAARRAAENYRLAQFEAFDMLAAEDDVRQESNALGLDILGLNYYFHNQWRHPSRRKIERGHPEYRPLHEILLEFHKRYDRPIFIAETGIEDEMRPDWLNYVCSEVMIAREKGLAINGVCLYPIANHPGWADGRHCHNGLWDYPDKNGAREIYQPLADELAKWIEKI